MAPERPTGVTARAAVLAKPRTLELRDFPLPAIEPGVTASAESGAR